MLLGRAAGALAQLALPGLTALALDGVTCAGPGAPGAFAFAALAHLTSLAELRLTRQLAVRVNARDQPAGTTPSIQKHKALAFEFDPLMKAEFILPYI